MTIPSLLKRLRLRKICSQITARRLPKNITSQLKDGEKGLILEVDLEYPRELHDMQNDYPVAPEKVKVKKNMLSDYCKKIAEKYNISIERW